MTDSSGNWTTVRDYYPYGAQRIDDTQGDALDNRFDFTNKERDDESGLSYFEARYLSTDTGRFISPDPVFLDASADAWLTDPQAQNAYAYARNNPVKYVDPDGEFFGQFGRDMAAGQRQVARFLRQVESYSYQKGNAAQKVGGFISGMAARTFEAGANVYDPDQNIGTRALGLGLVALDASTGGEGRVVAAGIGRAVRIGDDLGTLGRVVENSSGVIAGFSHHGLNQKITREVTSGALLETIRNPLVTIQQSRGTVLRLSEQAGAVLNDTGKVVTTYGKDHFNSTIRSIVDNIK